MTKKHQITNEFLVLCPDQTATPVAVSPSLYQDLDSRFNQFKQHSLVAMYTFESDWTSWEIHPKGDEMVMLIEGEITLVLDTAAGEQSQHLSDAGDYIVIPKNTWHTARTSALAKVLFITPGEGTEHKSNT
ncbi:cupin domain-containing protein [Zhongshania aliphaticivorans]|uniref:cupin domain-containing protein n=1 Tax=Zhongshania aliphaticivorans TaxID=1470434 RepID=UPI0012E5C374|nr:cupin domain-containing protein [Zhongshania aliphaticivorans]CAA0107073.1 Uncharacterised protein [Zhongshania aliphaticivorans]